MNNVVNLCFERLSVFMSYRFSTLKESQYLILFCNSMNRSGGRFSVTHKRWSLNSYHQGKLERLKEHKIRREDGE